MDRRKFLSSTAAASLLFSTRHEMDAAGLLAIDWSPLRRALGPRLLDVNSPLRAAQASTASAADFLRRIRNPFWIGDEPGLTQTLGWIDAWTSQPSLRAVAAESAADISAAIRFAVTRRVPLVVKGGGHSYFGNSNRAGSLLIWTHRMRNIAVHDVFRPQGAPAEAIAPAVSIESGTLWGEVYRVVARDHGRMVLGGGCLTVGTAGFIQGGGFGSFSKQFGTGAGNLLEAEVVTADGKVRVVNPWREPDLFFALRGGGGGTFGVVTRLTVRTHALPETFGAVLFEATAGDDDAWHELVRRTLAFTRDSLLRPEWGEQISFSPGRKVSVSVLCHSLNEGEIRARWSPLLDWMARPDSGISMAAPPLVIVIPGRKLWDPDFLRTLPGQTLADDRPGANPDNLFWATNRDEAGQVLNAYQSRWLPAELLDNKRLDQFAAAFVEGSAVWSMTLHLNKGLAGGSAAAVSSTAETATNPEVLNAFALLICAADAPPAYPGLPGHEPDVVRGRMEAARVSRAMQPIVKLTPGAGCYMSEANYHSTSWREDYWGSNYPKLVAAKRKYDPANVFNGHHVVELREHRRG